MQENKVLIEDYYSADSYSRIKAFADTKETPFVVIDNRIIRQHYKDLEESFPFARVHYAVKANPDKRILELLRDMGSNFDVASIYELERVLGLNVTPDRCSFGNTIKKRQDIRFAFEKGVRLFATDSEADIRNIATEAPGTKIYVRILTEGSHTADWPLSRKFGCQAEMGIELLALAQELGLEPYGLSFHVGSQQRDIAAWDAAIGKMKNIFDRVLKEKGITLKMINLGGGLPAKYLSRTHEIDTYASEITRFLREDFGDDLPEILIEPGRSMCANAGILVSEVVLISRKSQTSLYRWVFTDIGMFSGLIETLGESIKYPIHTEREGVLEEAVLAGPTCDGVDILYEEDKYCLPLTLEIGDRLYWLSTGAYTTSYSAVEFNGFPPLKQFVID
ncbi:MAG: type III PLP-dependent enzyme [Candidatus Marinimicrobia bacterium]|nr:type III PLP-dependent enzyme [Candidatus Neomarinimicrobiota bacterium]